MVDQKFLAEAKGLSVTERVELINELWASIDADTLPASPIEADLIDLQLDQADSEPLVGRSWEDVEASLRSQTALS